MRFLCGALVIATLATSAWAQEPAIVPAPELPDIVVLPAVHEEVLVRGSVGLAPPRGKVTDKKFWLVSAALNSSMLVDTWTTFNVRQHCPTCREDNPYVAPFVNRGPVATAVAGQLFDVGVLALAAKMKGSRNPRLRQIWWLVPVALTTGHVWAAHHNWQLAQQQRRTGPRP